MTQPLSPPGGNVTDNQASEPQPIDGARALQLLREVVVTDPDRNHVACVYQDGAKPVCVVGHALFRAGYGIDALVELEGWIPQDFVTKLRGFDAAAAYILDSAQMVQDRGEPWSAALVAAEHAAACAGVSA